MWGNLETMKQPCSVTFSPHSPSRCGCPSLCWCSHPPHTPQVRMLNRLEHSTGTRGVVPKAGWGLARPAQLRPRKGAFSALLISLKDRMPEDGFLPNHGRTQANQHCGLAGLGPCQARS